MPSALATVVDASVVAPKGRGGCSPPRRGGGGVAQPSYGKGGPMEGHWGPASVRAETSGSSPGAPACLYLHYWMSVQYRGRVAVRAFELVYNSSAIYILKSSVGFSTNPCNDNFSPWCTATLFDFFVRPVRVDLNQESSTRLTSSQLISLLSVSY